MRRPRKYVSPTTGAVSWRVRYRSPTGAQKSETFYDQAAADEFAGLLHALGPVRALDYIDKRDREAGGQSIAPVLTVDGLYAEWIAWKSNRNRKGEVWRVRSERTILDYDRMYAAHIKPTFGKLPANLVSPVDVQTWVDNLDLAPKTIAHYHALLHGLYKWGVHPSRGKVVVDPCSETELPKRQKTPPKGLRPAEWQILHAAARECDTDAADLLLFMASTGWRWSEAVAAQAKDVDHWIGDDGHSYTYVTMGRVLRREGNTFAMVDDAKSEAGLRRTRVVGAGEAMVLRRIYGRAPSDLILTTAAGKRWTYSSFYYRYWTRPRPGSKSTDYAPRRKRILERAAEMGLDRPGLTPHWLRHTQAFMLILAGEPLPAIQRRMGHANIATTVDVYGRMVDDASEVGLDRLAIMLGNGGRRPELP